MIEIRHAEINRSHDSQRAYDALYHGPGIAQMDSFYLWILHLLPARPGQSLLDISTGEGALVNFARRAGLRAYGFDFSTAAANLAARRQPGNIWVGDAQQMSIADRGFDFVVNLGSLEHYLDMAVSVRESARILRAEGWACYLLPNTYSVFGNFKYAWKTGEVFDDGQPLQRYNTRGGWQRLLEANGLSVKRVVKYERVWPRTWADAVWYLRRPAKIVRLLMTPFVPVNLANCLVYLCQKKV
jgi:SAM-dependent methyltransferase